MGDNRDSDSADSSVDAKCSRCKREIIEGQEAIECELCKIWVHAVTCEKMPKNVYNYISRLGSKLHWFCSKCDSHAIKTLNMLTKVHKSNEDLQKSFTDLEKKFEDFVDKNHTPVKETVKSADLSAVHVDVEIKEALEIENRKLNVVVKNMPNCNSEETESDQQEFEKILQKLKVKVDIDSCTRIGKITDGRQQLLRVKLKDYTQKMNLLKCCSSLAKCDEYKNVYISPDRTKRQQLADYKLRQELRHLRENGQTDFYIRRGTITKKKVATPQTQEESNMV